MQVTLKLQDFNPDYSSDATVHAYKGNALVGRVIFQFCADGITGDHRILLDFGYPAGLTYVSQAQIIAAAAKMVDSHFDDAPDVDPLVHDEIEV